MANDIGELKVTLTVDVSEVHELIAKELKDAFLNLPEPNSELEAALLSVIKYFSVPAEWDQWVLGGMEE